jgi:hypothetical protein
MKEMKHLRKRSGNVYEFQPTTTEALRSLLKTLNTQLTLHWNIRGHRFYTLKTGVLTADVMAQPEDVLSDRSTTSPSPQPAIAIAVN